MVSSPVVQVPSSSLDHAGLSVSTATPSLADPRVGTVYDPTVFAAAAPIWFHPLRDGRHLMLNARSWSAATPVGGIPGGYSDYAEDLTPTWTIVDGPTGNRSSVPGYAGGPPIKTATSARVLVGAVSQSSTNVYLLNSVQIAGEPQAVLQHLFVSPTDSVDVCAEEVLPTATVGEDTVVFDKGVQYAMPYLHLYGTDSTGQLYRIRKPWAQVGSNAPDLRLGNSTSIPQGWEYFHGTGYSRDPAELAPVQSGLTTLGPLSFAVHQDVVLASTVATSTVVPLPPPPPPPPPPDGEVGFPYIFPFILVEGPLPVTLGRVKGGDSPTPEEGTYVGVVWMSRGGRPFIRVGTVPLGSPVDGTYLGGVQLMSQLGANPAATAMTTTVKVGVPYVVSTREVVEGGSRLVNTWNLWPITA